jgi:hypothetical protein
VTGGKRTFLAAAIVIACGTTAGALIRDPSGEDSGRDPVAAAGCQFRITAPTHDEKVTTRPVSTVVEGTACAKDYVWLFDYDLGDHLYRSVNRTPVDVIGERWSQHDPLGNPDHPVGTKYRIVAVRVSRGCSRALEEVVPDKIKNTVRFPSDQCPPLDDAANAQSVIVAKGKADPNDG